MMELQVVKGPVEEALEGYDENDNLGHGCKIMLHLLCNWQSTKCRIICADSYFASTQAALELSKRNFRFIGVVKTATWRFPKAYLSSVAMPNRGCVAALLAQEGGVDLLAFVYCDHDQHYFISTCSNVAGGDPIKRMCLHQLNPVKTYEAPEHIQIAMNCPQAAQIYYLACGTIDRHNCYRQRTLGLEKKLGMKS